MKLILFFAFVMVAAAQETQEYYEVLPPHIQEISYEPESDVQAFPGSIPESELEHVFSSDEELVPHFGIHPRFRRDISMDPKTGDITADHKMNNGRVFGTVGSNDAGLFGKGGYERNIFNDNRGKLDAQAFGTRTLGPYGDTSGVGGALKWKNDNAAASFDINKQIHGPTSWTAAGGGRWPVGKNGDFGLEGTYSRMGGMKDYGGRATYNHRW